MRGSRWGVSSLCLFLICGVDLAVAHPGHSHRTSDEDQPMTGTRVWQTADQRIRGQFLFLRSGRVRIETPDGERLWLEEEELSPADQQWLQQRRTRLNQVNGAKVQIVQVAQEKKTPVKKPASQIPANVPADVQPLYAAFAPFEDKLKLRWDERYFLVESDGIPDHGMMIGITNWQQQVPLPQPYTGNNAWRIPIHPQLADRPISARKNLFRGAIALAVNGVPIFNALNNRGDDAFQIGELDEWGGHCGRADDYHYHAAPVHLEQIVGKGNPIAYALDGYPIYGLTEADGSAVGKLDEFNGQFDAAGHYHYHATKTYPYINGGLRGVVEVRGDQVEPQPHTRPLRPAGAPLRGASITDFKELKPDQFQLTYKLRGQTGTIDYTVGDRQVQFQFREPGGGTRLETFSRDQGPPPPPPRRR